MRRTELWMFTWPGLPLLWREGRFVGLALAIVFAGLLNLALISTLVWPGIFSTDIRAGLWLATVVGWIVIGWQQHRAAMRSESAPPLHSARHDALFIQAQTEYLKGNWDETEWLLRQRLSTAGRDIESRLLLLTTYRRRGRANLAREQLRILQRFDNASEWREEIEREARWLDNVADTHPDTENTSNAAPMLLDSTSTPATDMIESNRDRRAA